MPTPNHIKLVDRTKAEVLNLGAAVLRNATPRWNSRISSKLLRSAPGAAAHSGVGVFMKPPGTGGICQEEPDTFGDVEAACDRGNTLIMVCTV